MLMYNEHSLDAEVSSTQAVLRSLLCRRKSFEAVAECRSSLLILSPVHRDPPPRLAWKLNIICNRSTIVT